MIKMKAAAPSCLTGFGAARKHKRIDTDQEIMHLNLVTAGLGKA